MLRVDHSILWESYRGCGKPAVPPELLLRIALYEMLDQRQSPDRWCKDTKVDDNLKYLGRFIKPSRSTCYEFRARLGPIIRDLHQQLLTMAQEAKVLDARAGVLDGSFYRALGSRHRLLNEEQIQTRTKQLEESLKNPLENKQNPKWMGKTHRGRGRQAMRYAKACRIMEQRQLENSQRPKEKQLKRNHIFVSPSDPEAVLTRDKEKVFCPVYNVQNLVDPKSLIILASEVFASATDSRKLGTVVEQANRCLKQPLQEVWADAGYCSILDIQDAQSNGIELYAPFHSNTLTSEKSKKQKQIPKEQFTFLAEMNTYRCPQGHHATLQGKSTVWRSGNVGLPQLNFRVSTKHCQACPIKTECIGPNSKCRTIKRLEGSELLEEMNAKMATDEGKLRIGQRGMTIERTFGDTKQNRAMRRYHGYGLTNARIENGLMVLAQNIMTLKRLLANPPNSGENDSS